MELQHLDCKQMMFNPQEEGFTKSFRDLVPNIKLRDFKPIRDVHLFRYIVLMYDPKSPMVRDVSDYWQRKLECVEAAGFRVKADGSIEKPTEEFLLGQNQVVIDCIIDFLAYVKAPTWSALIFMYEMLLKYTNDSFSPSGKDSTKVEEVYKISQRIQDLTTTFLGEQMAEETNKFKKRLMYRVEEKRLGIRPEDFAERLAKGDELLDGNPYGNWVPTKIKFHGDSV